MLGKFEFDDEELVVLFHGTDHKSACNIMSSTRILLGVEESHKRLHSIVLWHFEGEKIILTNGFRRFFSEI